MYKSSLLGALFLFTSILSGPVATLAADEGSEPLSREESVSIDLVATITAIDPETREIQLEDDTGHVRSLVADARVLRFDELKVGDEVHATIEVSALAELREPTEAELAGLGGAKLGVVRSAGDGPLAGSLAESVTSVVMVVGLDLISEVITVVTADGDLVDVRAANVDNLKQLRLGDTIVVTYSASIVASVVPVSAISE